MNICRPGQKTSPAAKTFAVCIFLCCIPVCILLFSGPALSGGPTLQLAKPQPVQIKIGEKISFQAMISTPAPEEETPKLSLKADVNEDNKNFEIKRDSTLVNNFVLVAEITGPGGKSEKLFESVTVPPGQRKTAVLNYLVPEYAETGQYSVKVILSETSGKNTPGKNLGEAKETFVVTGQTVRAAIAIPPGKTDDLGEFRPGQSFEAAGQAVNTGEIRHDFAVTFRIDGIPEQNPAEPRIIDLAPGQNAVITFPFQVLKEMPGGQYGCILSIYFWSTIEKKALALYNETTYRFRVIDDPPVIKILDLGFSERSGKKARIKVKVTDDRGVTSVRIFYRLPGKTDEQENDMTAVPEEPDVYIFEPGLRQEGEFSFYIEAVDTKSQSKRTEKIRVTVIKK